MLDLWKKQLKATNFSLTHSNPNVFIISQWQKSKSPNKYYFIYRLVLCIFFVVALILSIIDTANLDKPYMFRLKWPIYLTNWGFLFCTIQSIVGTIMLGAAIFKTRTTEVVISGSIEFNCLYKIYWASNIIAMDAAFAITALYWAVVYTADNGDLGYLNLLVHAFNSVIMLIDFCIVAHPVRISHIYMPVLFGSMYSIFTVIYHLAGGTSRDDTTCIYSVLDWNKPFMALTICIGSIVFLVVNHCCCYVIYRIKSRIAAAMSQSETEKGVNLQIPAVGEFRGLNNEALENSI